MQISLKVKKSLTVLRSFLPVSFPQTPAALERLVQLVLVAGDFPDNTSFRSAIYTQVLHTSADAVKINPRAFITALRRSVLNQLSYGLMIEAKNKEKAENEEAVQSTDKEVV